MMLLAGLFCLGAAGLVADHYGSEALRSNAFQELTSLRESKRMQMLDYLEGQRRAVRLLSEAPGTLDAFKAFSATFQQLNDGSAAPPPPDLTRYYQEKYLPALARASTGVPLLESYLPAGRAARQLQTEYIADNPFPIGQRQKFLGDPNGNAYDKAHAEFHGFLAKALTEIGIDDLLLIDAHTGNVVYSVNKEEDFGTNLRTGPYARTGLARAFEHALDLHDAGAVWYESFSAYPPTELSPVAFLSAPVMDTDGTTVGVIAIRLSTRGINRVMTSDHHWADVGLGRTGSAYLVGSDSHARSDDRPLIENKEEFLKDAVKAGIDHETIARIDQFNSMILYLPINTEAASAALRGESGTGLIRDYFNQPVLSSWAPLNLSGIHWGVVAEMDADEAFEPQMIFRRALLIIAAISAVLLTIASALWANAFLHPIRDILDAVERLHEGDDTVRAPIKGNDEFSELGRAFNSMADEVALSHSRIREKTEEYEGLLKNVYPEVVAERVKLGQTSISEVVRNVSVIVLNIDGVSALFQNKECNVVTVMKDLIDAFDEAAERLGIEKLKTVGESYFAVSGLTTPRLDHAARAVAFAEETCRILDRLRRRLDLPLELRAGIASGDVEAGLIGRQRTIYDVWGTTMTSARRIVFEAGADAIRITAATHLLLSSPADFEPRSPITTRTLGDIATYERPALTVRTAASEA